MVGSLIFSISWSVLLLGLIAWFSQEIYYGNASTSWPKTKGQITLSELQGVQTWYHKFAYEYSVEGQTYSGKRKRFTIHHESSGSNSPAHKDQAKYPVETSVDVHYDPNNPSRAILEPGILV